MSLSDEQYRQILEDAFDRQIRGRLRPNLRLTEFLWQEVPFSPGPPSARMRDYREAIQIADLLGKRDNADAPEGTVFQFDALVRTQRDIANAFDRAKEELRDNGFMDALDENWPLIMEHIRPEHLPHADFEMLARMGEPDPRRRINVIMARMNSNALPELTTKLPSEMVVSAENSIGPARDGTFGPPVSGPDGYPRSRPRWWKGLGAIGSGSVLSLFNCGMAASLLLGFSFSPSDQTVGAISSVATGLGLIAQGVGELKRE
jgi:hypothetical protein